MDVETKLAEALRLLLSDCEQGADPLAPECRRITGSYDKAKAALQAYEARVFAVKRAGLSIKKSVGDALSKFEVGATVNSRQIYEILENSGAFDGYSPGKQRRSNVVTNLNRYMWKGYLKLIHHSTGSDCNVYEVIKAYQP